MSSNDKLISKKLCPLVQDETGKSVLTSDCEHLISANTKMKRFSERILHFLKIRFHEDFKHNAIGYHGGNIALILLFISC